VLDHHHVLPASTSRCSTPDQLLDVGHVQADRGLVEHVQRVRRPRRRSGRRGARGGVPPASSRRTLASSVTSLIRCASPPDSVGLCWPSVR
jgi:hypothetical protein